MGTNYKALTIKKIDKYLEKNATKIIEETDFIDICLDMFVDCLKYLGKAGYEFLKKKYMIGKHASELKGRLNAYKKMKNEYNIIESYLIIIDSGDYSETEYKLYVKHAKKLNKLCSAFKHVLPELDYLNPADAVYNYHTISDYMRCFSGRNGIRIS